LACIHGIAQNNFRLAALLSIVGARERHYPEARKVLSQIVTADQPARSVLDSIEDGAILAKKGTALTLDQG
jgi:hypothetical protein